MKKYIYSMIVLALGLSQFMAMGKSRSPVPAFRADVHQNLMRDVGPTHGHYQKLNLLNETSAQLKRSEACRTQTAQCQAFGDRVHGVFGVFASANASFAQSHLAGTIASKAVNIANRWEAPAQAGARVFLDGFVRGSGSLNGRTNVAIEGLLRHLGAGDALEGPQKFNLIQQKEVELRDSCA